MELAVSVCHCVQCVCVCVCVCVLNPVSFCILDITAIHERVYCLRDRMY